MSTSFWCSACKLDHAGACPPDQHPPAASFPNAPVRPSGGFSAGQGYFYGGASAPLVPAGPAPSMSPADFDDLVDEYLQLDQADLTDHYRAAKEALIRKLGGSPRGVPVP